MKSVGCLNEYRKTVERVLNLPSRYAEDLILIRENNEVDSSIYDCFLSKAII